MRALRIELRRSIAPWAGLLMVLLPLPLLFLLSGPWNKDAADWAGGTTSAALWLRWFLLFGWPVAIGAGAIQGMRDRRSGTAELLGSTPRPVGHRTGALASAIVLCLGAGFTALALVAFGNVLARGGFTSAVFLPVLGVGLLVVVAGGVLGLVVGRAVPHPLVAPGAAVLALVLLALASTTLTWAQDASPATRLAYLTAAFGDPAGSMITTTRELDVAQLVWFAGIIATGALLLGAKSARARALSLAPVVLAALVAVPMLPAKPADAFTADPVAAEKVCDGPVCVSRMHADRLPVVAQAGREALELLSRLPGAPTRVEEDTDPLWNDVLPKRSADVVYLNYQSDSALLGADVRQTRDALLENAGVPRCAAPNMGGGAEDALKAITLAHFTGALVKPPTVPESIWGYTRTMAETGWDRFRAQPEDVRWERIASARQAMLDCSGPALEAAMTYEGLALDALVPEGLR